jgi:hypothetical protein
MTGYLCDRQGPENFLGLCRLDAVLLCTAPAVFFLDMTFSMTKLQRTATTVKHGK